MNQTILQNNTQNATDIRSALANAGLDWTVEKRPIFIEVEDDPYAHTLIPNQYATVRSDTNEPLGIVGNKYHVIQNEDAFGICDDMVASRLAEGKEAQYSSVIDITGGRRMAVTIDLGEFEVVPGDTHKSFLTALTSHDGSTATRFMLLDFRYACFNAKVAAIKQARAAGTDFVIRHTAGSVERLQIARSVMSTVGYTQSNLIETLRDMASNRLNMASVNRVLESLFPMPDTAEEPGKSIQAKRDKVLELFEYNDNNAVPSIRGTALNLTNAVDEYVDHYASVRTGKGNTTRLRQERALFGTGADFKLRAMDTIRELALEA